jgi:hypothetical protein
MLDGYTGCTLENRKCVLLITPITIFQCGPRCLRSGVLATAPWAIEERMLEPC